MKKVVSVSLGSSTRNHDVVLTLLGKEVKISRVGTDGSLSQAKKIIRDLDGKVDAIGLGGIDLYLYTGKKRYKFSDAIKLKDSAKKTPVVDGSGLKNTIEKQLILWVDKNVVRLQGKKVLLVSAVDRYGMASGLVQVKAKVTFGDLICGLGLPLPINSLRTVDRVAQVLLPVVTKLPFHWLYPTGKKQLTRSRLYKSFYSEFDVLAGDWHLINKHLPEKLKNKVIITNTVTKNDIEEMKKRGLRLLITSTPHLAGRSFGTNVIEALILAYADKNLDQMSPLDYEDWMKRFSFDPLVLNFDEMTLDRGGEND